MDCSNTLCYAWVAIMVDEQVEVTLAEHSTTDIEDRTTNVTISIINDQTESYPTENTMYVKVDNQYGEMEYWIDLNKLVEAGFGTSNMRDY